MGCALGEVQDVEAYVARLGESPTARCTLLEGLRINSPSFDHLEVVTMELWKAAACFWGLEA